MISGWIATLIASSLIQTPTAPAETSLFNESGFLTRDKETASRLEAIQKSTTVERLDSIEQSKLKGISTKNFTENQAKRLPDAVSSKRKQLQATSQTKAA